MRFVLILRFGHQFLLLGLEDIKLCNFLIPDEVKAQLAGCELKNNLITLLRETEAAEDEDTLATKKLAADLIVLLLTGGKILTHSR